LWKSKPSRIEFFNGATISFVGVDGNNKTMTDTKGFSDKILGTRFSIAFGNEISEISENMIEVIRTRLAEKVTDKNGNELRNIQIYDLNPSYKTHWAYQRYFNNLDMDRRKIVQRVIDKFKIIHFHFSNNKFINSEYEDILASNGERNKQRFMHGEWLDTYEGEVFKSIRWETFPNIELMDFCVIYTDPSVKSQSKNDYKASSLVFRRQNKYYIYAIRAVRGTSLDMFNNIYDLYTIAKELGFEPELWIERNGLPDDYEEVREYFSEQYSWYCDINMDNSRKGDKYDRIESKLQPINEKGNLIFNIDFSDTYEGELLNSQFLSFSLHSNENDDIPDSIHGAVTILETINSNKDLEFSMKLIPMSTNYI